MSIYDRSEFEEWLELYVDGDLPAAKARRLEEAVQAEPAFREELSRARALRDRLRALPEPACPPDVTASVIAYARRDARAGIFERIRTIVTSNWETVLRPTLAVGVLFSLVVGGALITRPQSEQPLPLAATEDVERALNEAKWTLAYVSDIGRRTATSIRDEVFEERLVAPVNRVLDAALDDDQGLR